MSEYRHGTHSVFRLHVHLVWCTKYRRSVLIGEIGYRFRDLVRQMCSDMGVEILKGVVAKEHRSSTGIDTASAFGEQAGAEAEREDLVQATAGVPFPSVKRTGAKGCGHGDILHLKFPNFLEQ